MCSCIQVPHLVKLGVRMEFRDSLNKCAMALAKNLDRSKFLVIVLIIS